MLKPEFNPNKTPTGVYKAGKIRDENLQLILAAAEHEFVLQGYRGATIQGIADRAGLPKANVHYYFKSKSNLYVSVLNQIVELWNTQFSQIDENDNPAQALDSFIREKIRLSYAHPLASKLFAMEIISGAPHLQDYIRRDMRSWVRSRAKVIQTWVDRGLMDPVDPTQLIFLIWSSTQHYADFDTQVLNIMNHTEYEEEMLQGIADFLSSVILKGCGLKLPNKQQRRRSRPPADS